VKRTRNPREPLARVPLGTLLREVLTAAPAVMFASGAALYVVQLTDPPAFALAVQLHARIGGVDPEELRDRAVRAERRAPMMLGVAPVHTLARVLDAHDAERGAERARVVRVLAQHGAVPVLVMDAEGTEITTLAALDEGAAAPSRDVVDDVGGWFRPVAAEA
jgi:hypothetical protein